MFEYEAYRTRDPCGDPWKDLVGARCAGRGEAAEGRIQDGRRIRSRTRHPVVDLWCGDLLDEVQRHLRLYVTGRMHRIQCPSAVRVCSTFSLQQPTPQTSSMPSMITAG
jgi:hypothetical protein